MMDILPILEMCLIRFLRSFSDFNKHYFDIFKIRKDNNSQNQNFLSNYYFE